MKPNLKIALKEKVCELKCNTAYASGYVATKNNKGSPDKTSVYFL